MDPLDNNQTTPAPISDAPSSSPAAPPAGTSAFANFPADTSPLSAPPPTFTPPVTEPTFTPPAPVPALEPSGLGSAPFTAAPEPVPTFTPMPELSAPTTSPDTEPLPAPLTTPPSWVSAPIPSTPTAFSEMPAAAPAPLTTPNDSAPTDLSHLMDSPNQTPVAITAAPVAQPETLVVPPTAPEASQVVTSGGRGLPKWALLLGGVVMLLMVAGASAYFILGIGQTAPQTSLPAEQSTLTTPPKTVIPTTSPAAPAGLGNGSFGTLTGGSTPPATPTGAASPSGQTTSAMELLRQRGQR